jgi:hypothetical protein
MVLTEMEMHSVLSEEDEHEETTVAWPVGRTCEHIEKKKGEKKKLYIYWRKSRHKSIQALI